MTTPHTPSVACPGCGKRFPKRGPDAIYFCGKCRCQFDDDPDEGGDYSSDPSKRIEYQEAKKMRASQTRSKQGGKR
jgi:ribosomal protein L37AE/L43A